MHALGNEEWQSITTAVAGLLGALADDNHARETD